MTSTIESQSLRLPLGGRSIEVQYLATPGASQTVLMLHEALGSIRYWKDFPERFTRETETNVILYSRPGHGDSEGPLEERGPEHYGRQVDEVIPALLKYFGVEHPILYGHSEGAGISLLFAARSQKSAALILESPFVVPDQETSYLIQSMTAEYPGSQLQQKLAQYHQDPDAVFYAWVHWAISRPEDATAIHPFLADIRCPTLLLQGARDPFGVARHRQILEAELSSIECEVFAETGHLPHREQTDLLLSRVSRFLKQQRSSTDPFL